MLATPAGEPFDSDDWVFEVKWDGVRTLAFCDRDSTVLYSRTKRDVGSQYPEFLDLHRRLKGAEAVFDSEIVALDENSRPSFELLQSRINLSRPADVAAARAKVPLCILVFDVVFLEGGFINDLPLDDRMQLLGQALEFSDDVSRSQATSGRGKALFEAAGASGLEGIVAKKRSGRYEIGKRSRNWLKIKVVDSADFVIGGYTAGKGGRSGLPGALLLGVYEGEDLIYAGSVGTGFTDAALGMIMAKLKEVSSDVNPFSEPVGLKNVHYLRPELVCEVEYREVTRSMKLRAPSFKGLRPDKNPLECTAGRLQTKAGGEP